MTRPILDTGGLGDAIVVIVAAILVATGVMMFFEINPMDIISGFAWLLQLIYGTVRDAIGSVVFWLMDWLIYWR